MNDLKEIAQYTLDNWGVDAIDSYITTLLDKLDAIGKGEVVKEEYGEEYPNLYVTRFRYHKIYYKISSGKKTPNSQNSSL